MAAVCLYNSFKRELSENFFASASYIQWFDIKNIFTVLCCGEHIANSNTLAAHV